MISKPKVFVNQNYFENTSNDCAKIRNRNLRNFAVTAILLKLRSKQSNNRSVSPLKSHPD